MSSVDVRAKIDEFQRLMLIPVGILIGISIATPYAFGLVSTELKQKFNLGQEDLTTISTVGACFTNFPVVGGASLDYFGPRITLIIATVMSVTGMGLLSMLLSDTIKASVFMLSFANALLCWGCSWMDPASMQPSIFNFPLDKGAVIILQKTFHGLGSGIVAAYFSGFFGGAHYASYTAFLACMILVHGVIAAVVIKFPPFMKSQFEEMKEQQGFIGDQNEVKDLHFLYLVTPAPKKSLLFGYSVLASIVIFVTTDSIVNAYVDVASGARIACAAMILCLTLSFFGMPFIGSRCPSAAQFDSPVAAALTDINEVDHSTAFIATSFTVNLRTQALLWLMFWTSLCNMGTGLVFIVNNAQIFTALNDGGSADPHRTISLIVALMGVGSSAGRFSVGVSEIMLSQRKRSVSLVYPVPSIVLCVALTWFSFATGVSLVFPFCMAAFAHGFVCACNIILLRQTFKLDSGKHYGMCFLGALLAVVALNRFTFGTLYDQEGRLQGQYPACLGHSCVNTSFFILLAFNVTAVLSSIAVHVLRTKQASRAVEEMGESMIPMITAVN